MSNDVEGLRLRLRQISLYLSMGFVEKSQSLCQSSVHPDTIKTTSCSKQHKSWSHLAKCVRLTAYLVRLQTYFARSEPSDKAFAAQSCVLFILQFHCTRERTMLPTPQLVSLKMINGNNDGLTILIHMQLPVRTPRNNNVHLEAWRNCAPSRLVRHAAVHVHARTVYAITIVLEFILATVHLMYDSYSTVARGAPPGNFIRKIGSNFKGVCIRTEKISQPVRLPGAPDREISLDN